MPPADPTTQDQPDPAGPDEPDSSSAERAGGIEIQVVDHTGAAQADVVGWLDEQVRRAVQLVGIKQATLTFVIVADDEMATMHEQYTGVPGTTDVLTFDLMDSDTPPAEGGLPPGSTPGPTTHTPNAQPPPLEADIILCLDEAKRQAEQRDHEPRHELLLYAVHGLMHLLGEDDHDEDAYQRMHAREDALLEALGVGPLFHKNSSPPSDQPGPNP